MKTILAVTTILMSVLELSAQVKFDNISLDKALAKAESEGKLVFINYYTDWCEPCKILTQAIFSNVEVGNYMNSKFVNLNVNTASSEGPMLKRRYDITLYPTIMVVNSKGEEISRNVGADSDIKRFISIIETISNVDNSLPMMRKKFRTTIDGANKFILTLNDNYLIEERDIALISLYKRRTVEENFKKENFKLYKNTISSIYHPVAMAILRDGEQATKIIEKKEYKKFVTEKVNMTLVDYATNNTLFSAEINSLNNLSKVHKDVKTHLLQYFIKIAPYIDSGNIDGVIVVSEKSFKNMPKQDRLSMVRFVHRMAVRMGKIDRLIRFYGSCIDMSDNDSETKRYQDSQDLIKSLTKNR